MLQQLPETNTLAQTRRPVGATFLLSLGTIRSTCFLPPLMDPPHPLPPPLILPRVECHVPRAALSVPPKLAVKKGSVWTFLMTHHSRPRENFLFPAPPHLPGCVSPARDSPCSGADISQCLTLSPARGCLGPLWDQTERGGCGRRWGQCPRRGWSPLCPLPHLPGKAQSQEAERRPRPGLSSVNTL